MAIDGDVSLPLHTLSASGLVSGGIWGFPDLPGLTLSGSLEGPKPLPELTLEGTLLSGAVGDGNPRLPQPTLAGTALLGLSAVGSAILPEFTLAASTGNRGDAEFPPFTLSAVALAGSV